MFTLTLNLFTHIPGYICSIVSKECPLSNLLLLMHTMFKQLSHDKANFRKLYLPQPQSKLFEFDHKNLVQVITILDQLECLNIWYKNKKRKGPFILQFFLLINFTNVIGTVVEVLENLAYLANASNLVLYLSEYMHLSPSESANSVTNFMGTAFLLALLGGFLSDAFFTTYYIYLISAVTEFLVIIITTLFSLLISSHFSYMFGT